MQHQQAVEDHLVEQYLLNEMTLPQRDEFEEHFFDCRECAADLKSTAAFLQAARLELKMPEPVKASVVKTNTVKTNTVKTNTVPGIRPEPSTFWLGLWRPSFAFGALAACLLLIAYQNIVTYPKLNQQVARLEAPEVTPTLSLAGANSRGGKAPAASMSSQGSLLLLVDIPTQPRFSGYACQLFSPTNELVWTVQVSPEQAKDTVSLRIPALKQANGSFSLVVQGVSGPAVSYPKVEVARYSFMVNFSSSTPTL